MQLPELLEQARARLAEVHGTRFRGVVLYGSRARGDARPESDLDLMVLLVGPIDLWRDLDTSIRAIYPLQLQVDFAIHISPTDVSDFEDQAFALYRNARREGVRL
jgi:predicted nucleotidyltransferase